MFLVTDINSVAAFATMCAGFSIPHIVAFALAKVISDAYTLSPSLAIALSLSSNRVPFKM